MIKGMNNPIPSQERNDHRIMIFMAAALALATLAPMALLSA